MKSSIKVSILGAFALFAFFFSTPEKAVAQRGVNISFQTFYDELSPYGEWVNNPRHGYVWVPYAEPDFQPYATRGYWTVTEYGNTWVSDYEWGWAPFHYGRWFFDDYYGWAWVPGTEWGPSWVHWRSSKGYYGWAPLGPGVHINVAVNIPVNHWVFVPHIHITSPRIYHHYIPRRRVTHIYHNSVVINNVYVNNNYTYVAGPSRQDIERRTRRPVVVRTVDYSDKPDRSRVNNKSVSIYRPSVSSGDRSSARPSRVGDGKSRSSAISRENQQARTRTSATRQQSAKNEGNRKPATLNRNERTQSGNVNSRTASDRNARTTSATKAPAREKSTEQKPVRRTENTRSNNTRTQSSERTQVLKKQEVQRSSRQVQSRPVERKQSTVQSRPAPQRQRAVNSAPKQQVQRQSTGQRRSTVQRSAPRQAAPKKAASRQESSRTQTSRTRTR